MLEPVRRYLARLLICLFLPAFLAACGGDPVWAPDAAVQKAAFRSGNPPSVTLFTMIGVDTGAGGHSSLMIDGAQRVIFDPAGSWHYPTVPERNDVDYGITDQMYKFYINYHARKSWYVREQTVPVTEAQANAMIAAAEAYGPAGHGFCSLATSDVLRQVDGFRSLPHTMMPTKLSRAFAELPGVVTKDHHDNDPDDNSGILIKEIAQAPTLGMKAD